MFNDLENKRVIIAGGSGLIGKALVHGFKEVNADVINADKDGGDIPFNIGYPASRQQLFNKAQKIDVFVNCTYPTDFEAHTLGWFETAEMACESMLKHKVQGSIILFGSIYGVAGHDPSLYWGTTVKPPSGEYVLAKGGVVALTKHLACKYGQYGIRVNAILPGGVLDAKQDFRFVKKYQAKVPLGRMAEPKDLVGPVLFLASEAGAYMTGVSLVVDGGLTCSA